jgi:adenosine deaminase
VGQKDRQSLLLIPEEFAIRPSKQLNSYSRKCTSIYFSILVLSITFPAWVLAQAAAKSTAGASASIRSTPKGNVGEQRTARLLEAARESPADLELFFLRMPKGADLHNHLGGDIYAESLIQEGIEDHLCVDQPSLTLLKPQPAGECSKNEIPAAQAYNNQHLYDELVDAFSMRGFVPATGTTGHDHFFDAFAKFTGIDPRHEGEWLNEVAVRAAAQNEQYLELMDTPNFTHTAALARQIGWQDDFGHLREELLSRGLRDDIALARARFDQAEEIRRHLEHCGEPNESAACHVEIRYLYQILRGFPKEQVFAQTLLGFETAASDPRVVGINYVMPEDGYISMSDYALHMRMVGFLHSLYPKVHISLHAGELAPGLVPYEGLCCHIRLAVEQAHAERIGHGVDVMYEDRPFDLLRELAAKHILVEITLTSNQVILGVSGKEHPFPIYRKFGVPVALATDDEGVSRIRLTHEYVRAAETYNLHYSDFKQMVRDSIEHSFLPGDSLWSVSESFATPVPACSQGTPGEEGPSPACAAFLQHSEKAQQQWELERRFRAFESTAR